MQRQAYTSVLSKLGVPRPGWASPVSFHSFGPNLSRRKDFHLRQGGALYKDKPTNLISKLGVPRPSWAYPIVSKSLRKEFHLREQAAQCKDKPTSVVAELGVPRPGWASPVSIHSFGPNVEKREDLSLRFFEALRHLRPLSLQTQEPMNLGKDTCPLESAFKSTFVLHR